MDVRKLKNHRIYLIDSTVKTTEVYEWSKEAAKKVFFFKLEATKLEGGGATFFGFPKEKAKKHVFIDGRFHST